MDILNPSNWILIHRNLYKVQQVPDSPDRYYPLATINIPAISSRLLVGGRSSKAKSHWYLAASVAIKASLSLANSSFVSSIQAQPVEYKLPLNRLVLFEIKNFQTNTYCLEIKIPYWHEEMEIEVWKYQGTVLDERLEFDTNDIIEHLQSIKEKLDTDLNSSDYT